MVTLTRLIVQTGGKEQMWVYFWTQANGGGIVCGEREPHKNSPMVFWPERLCGFSEMKERNGFVGKYQRELIQGQLEYSSNSTKCKGRQESGWLWSWRECERVDNGIGAELWSAGNGRDAGPVKGVVWAQVWTKAGAVNSFFKSPHICFRQLGKLRLREVKQLAQGHTIRKW